MPLNDAGLHLALGMYDAVDQVGKGIDNGIRMQVLTNALADVVMEFADGDPQAVESCSVYFHHHFVKCLNLKKPPLTDFIPAED